MTTKSSVTRLAGLAVAATVGLAATAGLHTPAAADTIKIGELNSYAKFAAFTVPYRNGWQLALEEVNAAGGVMGKQLEIVSRDDGGTTGDAVRVAEELVSREGVSFLFGTFLSNTGLAVADFANQNKTLFLAAEPLSDALTMEKGNKYTFRMRPNTYMQTAMLVEQAKDSGIKRWAIVAPNYEYGQSAGASFKQLIAEAIPGAEIVAEQYPALGKIDAGATVAAIDQAKPDGIFNATFGGDQAKFVREGNTRGLFEGRTVLSLLTGEPEWMLVLGGEAPEGWITTGYPWEQIELPAHKAFVDAYQKKFNDTPRLGSFLGYTCVYTIKAAIEKAGGVETDKLIAALEGLTVETVAGPMTIRASDHQSTMGAWVGLTTLKDGKGAMKDWFYADGAKYMHSEEEVMKARPK
jgi:branched-chain amino acid transport system substrate-binding protein